MKQLLSSDRLLSCRNELGLTQSEAARLIGITQPAYQRYEAGVRSPSVQVVKEIAKAFNVSVSYLYGESDQPVPDYYLIDKKDDKTLFSIVEQCKGYNEAELKEILRKIKKYKKGLEA